MLSSSLQLCCPLQLGAIFAFWPFLTNYKSHFNISLCKMILAFTCFFNILSQSTSGLLGPSWTELPLKLIQFHLSWYGQWHKENCQNWCLKIENWILGIETFLAWLNGSHWITKKGFWELTALSCCCDIRWHLRNVEMHWNTFVVSQHLLNKSNAQIIQRSICQKSSNLWVLFEGNESLW